ncbi:MAG: hypothetical protein LBF83_11600, partial [Spirochaetaceae bacterium]|nr:hypothetical protein [Spirochaetaceae bacterium]
LRQTASPTVAFCELEAGDDAESTFKRIEAEIAKIMNAREDYIGQFAAKEFRGLPSFATSPDLSLYADHYSLNGGSVSSALLSSLRAVEYSPQPPPPPGAPPHKKTPPPAGGGGGGGGGSALHFP